MEKTFFFQAALSIPIVEIVNNYLGCYSWLMDYNIWFSSIANSAPQESQLWHRDQLLKEHNVFLPNCRNIIKIFIYLSNVDSSSGPLSYMSGTQKGGIHEKILF